MSETYIEHLVKAKRTKGATALRVLLLVLMWLAIVITVLLPNILTFAIALIAGVAAHYQNVFTDLEYEYLYLDREISVDKIMKRTVRRKVARYSLESMEIFAPVNSYHLDNYKNRKVIVKDYSIREELKPDLRYAMYCDGGFKVILSPSEEMVKALKNAAPRKVFTD